MKRSILLVLTIAASALAADIVIQGKDMSARHRGVNPADGRFSGLVVMNGSGGFEDVFTTLENLATELEANAPNGGSLEQLDRAMDHLLTSRGTAGARLNALDSQENINGALLVQLEQTRSTIEDLDYAEAATRLSQESVILQAAQQSFVQVQNLNLFNYL